MGGHSPDSGPGWGPNGIWPGHARSIAVQGLSRNLTGRAPGFEQAPYGHARDAPWSPGQGPFVRNHIETVTDAHNQIILNLTLLWVNYRKPHTGLKRGCPCPDWPRCAHGAPYRNPVRDQTGNVIWEGPKLSLFWKFCHPHNNPWLIHPWQYC